MRALLTALAASLLSVGCGDRGGPGGGGGYDPAGVENVLLITVDTLRADRIGPLADGTSGTPHLDRLSGESLVFDGAFSQATVTHSALTSVLTGLVPPRHGVALQMGRMHRNIVPLPLNLQASDIETGAFVANLCRMIDQDHTVFSVGWDEMYCGMLFGDDGLPIDEQWVWDRRCVDRAIRFIRRSDERGDRPWFVWVHLMDPHSEHRPPPEHWDYADEPLADKRAQLTYYNELQHAGEVPDAESMSRLQRGYDAEIRGVDDLVGELLGVLDEVPDGDGTAVIFSADHGEELFESWVKYGHGLSLTRGVLRVPLTVKAPGLAPARAPELVETLQITPTVLHLFDIAPPYLLDGPSLLARDPSRDYAVSFAGDHVSARQGDVRVWIDSEVLEPVPEVERGLEIETFNQRAPWFQDELALARYADAGAAVPEFVELEGGALGEAERLRDELERFLAELGPLSAAEAIDDPELAEFLAELGYATQGDEDE